MYWNICVGLTRIDCVYIYFIFIFLSKAAQQQKPVMMSPTKLVATNTMLSRSYNSGTVVTPPRAVSATQIAKELLHTQGIQGLYKGLGATLIRYSFIPCSRGSRCELVRQVIFSFQMWNIVLFDFFQGCSLFCCLLPAVRQPEPPWPTQPRCVVTLLLGFPLRLCSWIYSCSGCEPLWWWVWEPLCVHCMSSITVTNLECLSNFCFPFSSGEDETAITEQGVRWGDVQWSSGLCKVRQLSHPLHYMTPNICHITFFSSCLCVHVYK